MKRIGVYAGTFDPFTIGHADIVRRALALFDEVHIVIGVNFRKTPFMPVAERLENIKTLYQNEPRIRVVEHSGIVARYAQGLTDAVLVRGIRTVADMEQERTTADVNRNHFGVDTIFLFSDTQFSSVSSSLVRELGAFGEDYSEYLPKP